MESMAQHRRVAGFTWVLIVLFAAGCGNESQSTLNAQYRPTSSMHEFMLWYLEPAADVLWDNAGFIVTAEGEEDLQPTTDEGWVHVRNHATVVAEAGNLLQMPGYAVAESDWMEYAAALVDAGLAAREAAQDQDAEALFQAGANLYSVCRACHNRYIIQNAQ